MYIFVENGQTVVIRTCSMEDWGTQCGDIFFEQGRMRESLTGCLATCPFDGCNSANPTGYFMRKVPFSPYLPTFLLRSNPLMLICLITSTLLTTGTSFKFSDLCGNFLLGHTWWLSLPTMAGFQWKVNHGANISINGEILHLLLP